MSESRTVELRRVLKHLDTLYEAGDDCIHPDTGLVVPDDLYDDWVQELKTLSPKEARFTHQPTDSVTDHVNSKHMIHEPPMVSINKASHEDLVIQTQQLFKWIADSSADYVGPLQVIKDYPPFDYPKFSYNDNKHPFFYQTYKLDGAACSIRYEKGRLVQAGLRPRDGIHGMDVTEQIKFVQNVPQKLNEPLSLTVRGELICLWSDFEKVQKELAAKGEKLRANPRNHAAGAIQNDDPKKVGEMRLTFIAYGIENLANPPYKTEIERAKWCNKRLGIQYVRTQPFDFHDLKKLEDGREELDYMVDGLVIGVDNLEDQEQLGRHGDPRTGNPKGKIAWKFREDAASPVVKAISNDVGRTGHITPVAEFDAVRLAETDVTRATLHNYGFVKRFGIQIGTRIKVVKAGSIIPKVIDVVSGTGTPNIPSVCPSCGSKTKFKEGGEIKDKAGNKIKSWGLFCENADCPAKKVNGLLHYLSTLGVLGLGESRVESFAKNSIKTFADFYRLDEASAIACGLTERQALLAIAAIHMLPDPEKEKDNDKLRAKLSKGIAKKKKIPAWKLFAAFGIPTAGESAGKALIDYFRNFDSLRSASVEDLHKADGVGEKTAEVIKSWFEEHEKEVDDLLNFIELELPKTGPLTGKSFCLSGSFVEGKSHWQTLIESQGGKVTGNVGQSTTYLVAGPGSGSKSDKAKELGTKIIDEEELKKLLC